MPEGQGVDPGVKITASAALTMKRSIIDIRKCFRMIQLSHEQTDGLMGELKHAHVLVPIYLSIGIVSCSGCYFVQIQSRNPISQKYN